MTACWIVAVIFPETRLKADLISWAQAQKENSYVVCTFTESHGNKASWNEDNGDDVFSANDLMGSRSAKYAGTLAAWAGGKRGRLCG